MPARECGTSVGAAAKTSNGLDLPGALPRKQTPCGEPIGTLYRGLHARMHSVQRDYSKKMDLQFSKARSGKLRKLNVDGRPA
eukprot:CAMPEP_0204522696 /NCGR_PEP_ID=MMETSP0661-20131031/6462_1 /ASSEMBLY_ACC=CAM_ASM_000606 /TAXON_ID=109239 /ORGANISM="Alexandrium margalefi, Strain AMGDE01CS-322" /LENGTH=81 /DNA_ID=CAMNT_0051528377 /DNA_START=46 /DNA_END=288 /DNA_ORIENTATION=+